MKLDNKRWFIGIGIFFLLVTNIVFIRLYLQTPPEHQYTGLGFEASADKFVYYSMIQQGMHGKLFMENVHTSEPQLGLLFSPHWYLIGRTASLLHVSIPASYHLYRVLLTVLFLWLVRLMVEKLFEKPSEQIGAFAIVLFSSGLGWLYFVAHPWIADSSVHWMQHFNSTPIDLYVTEFSPFTNTLQSPLFILSFVLILTIWFLALRSKRSFRVQILLACLVALIGSIHPYDMFLIATVLGSYAVWEIVLTKSYHFLTRLWPVALGLTVAGVYQAWSLIREPALSGWLSQNITFSPLFSNYLWGMSIVGPLALLGIWYMVRLGTLRNPYWRLVLLWAFTILVLIYLPVSINRRFANTLLIPWSLLASYGLIHVLQSLRNYLVQMTVGIVCALLLSSGVLYQVAESLFYIPTLSEKYNYYLDSYMSEALSVLHQELSYTDVLLPSTEFIGILSAAYAPTRLFVGHAHQTVQYELKKNQMEWFFAEPQGDSGLLRRQLFLQEKSITTIVVYKPGMTASYDWLDTLPGVIRIYDSPVTRLFRVHL